MLKIVCFFLFILFFYQISHSQRVLPQLWSDVSVSKKVSKKLNLSLGLTNRLGEYGLTTVFSQFSVKYSPTNWLRPSIDYRLISSRDNNGNYLINHRINSNIQFSKDVKRFNFQLRLRYQYSFSKLTQSNYDPEFDLAYRIKPSISYDINNCILSPLISVDYFYSPINSALGNRFTRARYFIGTTFEMTGPHELTIGYIYDKQINLPDPLQRHIASITYNYKLKSVKKKD